MTANGLIWCSTPKATVGLVVADGRVVDCPPYARRWAMGRDAREVWRQQHRAGADLVWMEDQEDILAIVGSTTFAAPNGLVIARSLIEDEVDARRPDAITSGGADGIDTLAEQTAERHGIRFIGHRPRFRRWNGEGGFKQRNERIAATCTRALRISCANSTTYGSGWTVDQAAKAGKPVRRVRINADGTVVDSGWPTDDHEQEMLPV